MIFITNYKVESKNISNSMGEFKVLQISDLHSVRSTKMVSRLAKKIENEKPNIIVITGDLIDGTYYNEEKSKLTKDNRIDYADQYTVELIKNIIKTAPIYYVYGNHEMMLLEEHDLFLKELELLGVHMMNNKSKIIEWNGIHINLLGIQDPSTLYKDMEYAFIKGGGEKMQAMLDHVTGNMEEEDFTILLSHRPEYLELYGEYPIDLVLAGHAHGGQIVIPLIGGIYAPNQGWFPDYTHGLYSKQQTKMIVSRGIGNSKIPFRVLNPPEIVVVSLQSNQYE